MQGYVKLTSKDKFTLDNSVIMIDLQDVYCVKGFKSIHIVISVEGDEILHREKKKPLVTFYLGEGGHICNDAHCAAEN